jgi:hypothetical protein
MKASEGQFFPIPMTYHQSIWVNFQPSIHIRRVTYSC